MTRIFTCLLALLFCSSVVKADASVVTLVQEKSSVKVMIGEDVFTVFHYGKDRQKPFFLPVTGPGGYELLQAAVVNEQPGSVGRKVVVASESVTLKKGNAPGRTVRWGDLLEIDKVEGNQLRIQGTEEWISRADIAPAAALIIRLINDSTEAPKDLLSDEKYDHVHHKGIWFAVDAIQGNEHWGEKAPIRTQSVKLEKSGTNAAELHFVNHWVNNNEEPLLVETTTVTITSDRFMIYDTVLSPAINKLHIGDTKEGLLAIRLASTMHERNGGGPVTSAEGVETTAKLWGKPARWINYDGPIDGHTFGVAIMDGPKNPWPSRFHVRNYGLFSLNPFGAGAYTEKTPEAQPKHDKTLNQGDSLHFTFGLWIHGANATPQQINAKYEKL